MAQQTLAAKETTRQPVIEGVALSSDSHTLIVLLDEKTRECSALRKRMDFLQMRLEQRQVDTENRYVEKKRWLDSMCDLCYKVFLADPERGFTYDEFILEFQRFYPKVPCGHVQRRLRDLRDKKLLWSNIDKTTGEVRYWLKLEELPEEEKEEDAEAR